MRNPLRSEAEAFRFLIVVIVGAAVIVGASYANTWAGVAAAIVVVGLLAWWLTQPPVPAPPDELVPAATNGPRRVLLLAAPGTTPAEALAALDGRAAEVLVVVPALASPLEALTGDVDDRREQAQASAEALARALEGAGRRARGGAGADDPLLAVEDALREFGADEVVLAGDEELLARARERIAVPVSLLR